MEHPPLPHPSLPGPPPPPPPSSAYVPASAAVVPPPPPPPDPSPRPGKEARQSAGGGQPSGSSHRRSKQKQSIQKPQPKPQPTPRPSERRALDNNLTRDTPFVANIKFRNTLPELPCDPKMLARQLDTEALSRFHLTNAEENLRPELVLAPDASALSAMHMHEYCYDEDAGDLHPDDRALIEGHLGARTQRGNVAWLMKTRYLHATSSAPASNKGAVKVESCPTVTLAEAKQQIEASFRAAKEPPVHPMREGIHAVQVMPLLPFFERYGHTHVTASSTSEVVTHVLAQGTSEQDRESLYGECMMRSYPMPDGQQGREYLALLLPSKAAPEHDPEATAHAAGRYTWAREFAVDKQEFGDSSKSYVLALSDQGARYVPIESNILLSKRKRDDLASIEPPEYVDVQQRELSSEEQAQHKQRIGALYGFDMHDEQETTAGGAHADQEVV